jgi:hypothetical protein
MPCLRRRLSVGMVAVSRAPDRALPPGPTGLYTLVSEWGMRKAGPGLSPAGPAQPEPPALGPRREFH